MASPKPAPERLTIQMIPLPLWRRNLRALMNKNRDWRELRQALLAKNGLVCQSCGKMVEEAKKLHAHEEWRYMERSEPAVAWLWGVSMICFHCHAVEHPGVLNALIAEGQLTKRAQIDTDAHFQQVNGLTKRQMAARLRAAFKDFERRSSREWYIDYGPFASWMFARFERDPLNDLPWSENFQKRWGVEPDLPTMEQVVNGLKPLAGAYPSTQHGFYAHILDAHAEEKAEKRRKKALKKKRAALKAAREAEKASRAKAHAFHAADLPPSP